MRSETIAGNYADALLELARRAEDLDGWARMLDLVATAMQENERLRHFLESPRISARQKNEVLAAAFQDRMPRLFVRYLQMLVKNRRQMLIPEIALAYHGLLDEVQNRVRARVTLAMEPRASDRKQIADRLGKALGKEVVPVITVNPALLGGVIVRVGDTVMDGSVRRRLATLRSRLAHGPVG